MSKLIKQAAVTPIRQAGKTVLNIFDEELAKPERNRKRLEKWLDYAMPPKTDGRWHYVENNPAATLERKRTFLGRAPEQDMLVQIGGQFVEALTVPATAQQTAVIVAALLDCYPNARPSNPAIYLEGMTFIVAEEGYSPSVMATAVMEILAKQKFPPAISELVEKCAEVKGRLAFANRQINHLLDLILDAEDALIEAGEMNREREWIWEDDDD